MNQTRSLAFWGLNAAGRFRGESRGVVPWRYRGCSRGIALWRHRQWGCVCRKARGGMLVGRELIR